jgi:signal transduction histidine kinase
MMSADELSMQTEAIITQRAAARPIADGLAVIVHELIQPITVIGALADMLCRRPENAVQYGTRIAEQISRISAIMHACEQQLHRTPIAINKLIREVLDWVTLAVNPRDVRVTLDLDDEVELTINKGQIEQVIANLIRNAFEAMPCGGELTVRAVRRSQHLDICIIDDGPGVSDSVVTRLFEPYVTTKSSGMGIGLAISHAIVQAHGGVLALNTMRAKGACFVVSLPLI